jgi:hypothetical protein
MCTVVTFYDARLDDVVVLRQHSLSFKQAVRDAVLWRLHVDNVLKTPGKK